MKGEEHPGDDLNKLSVLAELVLAGHMWQEVEEGEVDHEDDADDEEANCHADGAQNVGLIMSLLVEVEKPAHADHWGRYLRDQDKVRDTADNAADVDTADASQDCQKVMQEVLQL